MISPYTFDATVEYGTYAYANENEYIREYGHPFSDSSGRVKAKMYDISTTRRATRVDNYGNMLSDLTARLRASCFTNTQAMVSLMNEPGWMRSRDGQVLDKKSKIVIRKARLINGEPGRANYDAVVREREVTPSSPTNFVNVGQFYERRFESVIPSPTTSAKSWATAVPGDDTTQSSFEIRARSAWYSVESSLINKIRTGDTVSGNYGARPIITAPNSINFLGGIESLLGRKRAGTNGVPNSGQTSDDMVSALSSSGSASGTQVAANTPLVYDVHSYDPYQYAYQGDSEFTGATYWMRDMPYVGDSGTAAWNSAIDAQAAKYTSSGQYAGQHKFGNANPTFSDPDTGVTTSMSTYLSNGFKAGGFGTKNYLRHGDSRYEGASGIEGLANWAGSSIGSSVYVGEFGFLADMAATYNSTTQTYQSTQARRDLFAYTVRLMNAKNTNNSIVGWSIWALDDSKNFGIAESVYSQQSQQWFDKDVLKPNRVGSGIKIETSLASSIGLNIVNN